MKKNIFILTSLATLLFACSKPSGNGFGPSSYTYNFDNVDYTEQSLNMLMLEEMLDYAKTGEITGTTLNVTVLENMFSNTGSPFADATLNSSGFQLKSNCFPGDLGLIQAFMDSLVIASSSAVPGSNGISGIIASVSDTSNKFLLSANGWDYTEMIEKGIMGSVFYYQSLGILFENISADDNLTVVSGQGTDMEHHFDEVFG